MSTVLYKINKIKYELRNSFLIKYDGKPINHKVVKAQPKLNHFYLRCLVELWQDLWFSIQQFGKIILEVQAVVLRVVCQIDDSPLYVVPPILYKSMNLWVYNNSMFGDGSFNHKIGDFPNFGNQTFKNAFLQPFLQFCLNNRLYINNFSNKIAKIVAKRRFWMNCDFMIKRSITEHTVIINSKVHTLTTG